MLQPTGVAAEFALANEFKEGDLGAAGLVTGRARVGALGSRRCHVGSFGGHYLFEDGVSERSTLRDRRSRGDRRLTSGLRRLLVRGCARVVAPHRTADSEAGRRVSSLCRRRLSAVARALSTPAVDCVSVVRPVPSARLAPNSPGTTRIIYSSPSRRFTYGCGVSSSASTPRATTWDVVRLEELLPLRRRTS